MRKSREVSQIEKIFRGVPQLVVRGDKETQRILAEDGTLVGLVHSNLEGKKVAEVLDLGLYIRIIGHVLSATGSRNYLSALNNLKEEGYEIRRYESLDLIDF